MLMNSWTKLATACLMALLFLSCGEDSTPVNGYIETTQDNASTLVLKGYASATEGFTVFQPTADFASPFYIQEKAFYGKAYRFAAVSEKRLDAMTSLPADGAWQESVAVTEGTAYWARYATAEFYRYVKFRVAYIDGNDVGLEYVVSETVTQRPNTNSNKALTQYAAAANLEMPHIDTDNYTYVEHFVDYNGQAKLNYAYEWSAAMKHANWVAFSFDEVTTKKNVSKTDAWDVDPSLPEEIRTSNSDHTWDGFDRGHICASGDRLWSTEANAQTFYFSNMSPQLATFNQNFWVSVENQIRAWGSAIPTTYDELYVAKGGTLNHLLKNFTGTIKDQNEQYPTTTAEGFTVKGLACPQYYFAAVLARKNDAYQAIAFLVEHREDLPLAPTVAELQQYVVSIDKLEQFSGLDFFCNLPDAEEESVEASFSLDAWSWSN